MMPGFNTDLMYHGETYHVQTEDNGVNNPVVVTLLYFKGAILASRRTSYRHFLVKPSFQGELRDLMKSQHKELMRELLAGKYDNSPGYASSSQPAPISHVPDISPVATATVITEPVSPKKILTLHQAIFKYLEEFATAAPIDAATVN